jgi:hypothetical protein
MNEGIISDSSSLRIGWFISNEETLYQMQDTFTWNDMIRWWYEKAGLETARTFVHRHLPSELFQYYENGRGQIEELYFFVFRYLICYSM